MHCLSETDRKNILELARQAVEEAVPNEDYWKKSRRAEVFERRCGVFVTLHVAGKLRGCIGVIEPKEQLGESVVRCATGAAVDDPRFHPMQPEELARLASGSVAVVAAATHSAGRSRNWEAWIAGGAGNSSRAAVAAGGRRNTIWDAKNSCGKRVIRPDCRWMLGKRQRRASMDSPARFWRKSKERRRKRKARVVTADAGGNRRQVLERYSTSV